MRARIEEAPPTSCIVGHKEFMDVADILVVSINE